MLSSSSVRCKVVDGAQDQGRTVVDRHDVRAFRQAAFDLGEPFLHVGDNIERVLPVALDGDARHDLTLAVQFRQPAPFVGRQLDARHVAEQHGRAAFGFEHDLLEIGGSAQIAAPAHHEFGFGHLDHAAADIHVRGAHGVLDSGQRDSEGLEPFWIDDDRVLANKPADARDFRHALGLGDGEPHLPVLRRAQLGE